MNRLKSSLKYIKQYGISQIPKKINTKIKLKRKKLDEYGAWIYNNEPSKSKLQKQKNIVFFQNIKFEIICEKNDVLLKSLNEQTYKNFSVVDYKENIKDIINSSKSDYIIFVGKNISLAPFALFEIANCIESNNVMLVYSDNDKLINGNRTKPHFKPGFAKDTIVSQNYIGDFIAVKTELLKNNRELINGLNKDYIYDLILRISEQSNEIEHISKVLYHELNEVMPIKTENEKTIIASHLNRLGLKYKNIEDGKFKGQYRINYEIEGNPKVSIVIPNKDHIEDLDKLLKSIEKSTYSNYEVVIVENNSQNNETFKYYEDSMKNNSKIRVVNFKIDYFNYSSIVNFGVENSEGEYIVLLNNDIEFISQDWIEGMLMYAQRKDVGICGVKLYFPDRSIQHAGVTIGIRGLAGHKNREVTEKEYHSNDYINIVQDLSAVTAACFMVKKSIYNDMLGFDEKLAVAFNDVDFCLKVRQANYLVVYNPFVEGYHYESKSRGEDTTTPEKQKRFEREYGIFVKRWRKFIDKGDLYYNKNYRLDTDIPRINTNKII